MDAQWKVFKDPHDFTGLDKCCIKRRLRVDHVATAERALEVRKFNDDDCCLRIATVRIARHRIAWSIRISH